MEKKILVVLITALLCNFALQAMIIMDNINMRQENKTLAVKVNSLENSRNNIIADNTRFYKENKQHKAEIEKLKAGDNNE